MEGREIIDVVDEDIDTYVLRGNDLEVDELINSLYLDPIYRPAVEEYVSKTRNLYFGANDKLRRGAKARHIFARVLGLPLFLTVSVSAAAIVGFVANGTDGVVKLASVGTAAGIATEVVFHPGANLLEDKYIDYVRWRCASPRRALRSKAIAELDQVNSVLPGVTSPS